MAVSATTMLGGERIVFGPVELPILLRLLRGDVVTSKELAEIAYGDRANGGPEFDSTCIRMAVMSLRKKLRPAGYRIHTHYHWGYRLIKTEESNHGGPPQHQEAP